MTSPRTLRRLIAPLAAGILAAFFLVPSLAASPSTDFVALRIEGDHDKVVIEMPVQLLQYLADHTKEEKFDVGHIGGRDTKVTMADLMKLIQSGKAKDHEVLLLSEKDEHGETSTIYIKTFARPRHGAAGKPTGLAFTVLKDGKEKVSLSVAMDTVESWAKDFGSGEKGKEGDDFGPLVRSALASAQELGTGVLLHIESKDAELIFSLK
jgi:hypothetical protein